MVGAAAPQLVQLEPPPAEDNTGLKNRLTAYAAAHPGECRQTDADPDTGCMEFEIRKGRFSFRLTAPYSAERRWAASEAAKKRIKGF